MKLSFPLKIVPFSRFEVVDRSMEPAFRAGDRVVTFNWDRPIKGSVVVLRWRDKFQIKRVKLVDGEEYLVAGDNKKLSSGEKKVSRKEIIGRVFLKY